MGADIRKAIDLSLRVALKEERFSHKREWDSRTWLIENFRETC